MPLVLAAVSEGLPAGSCPPCGRPGPGARPQRGACAAPSAAVPPSSLFLTSPAQGLPLRLLRELTLAVLKFPAFMFHVAVFILLISAFYNFLPCTVFFVFSCCCFLHNFLSWMLSSLILLSSRDSIETRFFSFHCVRAAARL